MPSHIVGEDGLSLLRISVTRTVTRSWHSLGLKAELATCRQLDQACAWGRGCPGTVTYLS